MGLEGYVRLGFRKEMEDPPLDHGRPRVRAGSRTRSLSQAALHRCRVGFRKALSGGDGDDAISCAAASPASAHKIESTVVGIPEGAADSRENS